MSYTHNSLPCSSVHILHGQRLQRQTRECEQGYITPWAVLWECWQHYQPYFPPRVAQFSEHREIQCLCLWLLWRTRYAQMFYHQKRSELPISLRHLGLTQHCQGWHFIINYTLFFPPTHQFSSSKKKKNSFLQDLPSPPISFQEGNKFFTPGFSFPSQ